MPHTKNARAGLHVVGTERRIWAFHLIGERADAPTPKGYLLNEGEAAFIEAMRRGERQHPYAGTRAA